MGREARDVHPSFPSLDVPSPPADLAPLHVVMTAAHAGYPAEQHPVGGAAAICERLARAWSQRSDVRLTVLGPGPSPPPGVHYVRIDVLQEPPCQLGALAYARFCRAFERATTDYILGLREPCAVLVHDLSEGPDHRRLAQAGIPAIVLVHVDVVEYFARMYLGSATVAPAAARLFGLLRPSGVVPDVLRLVFDKQQDAVEHARHLVVPSPAMLEVLQACYPGLPPDRVQVMGWGGEPPWRPTETGEGCAALGTASREASAEADAVSLQALQAEMERLRSSWSLEPEDRVIITLSRISPEKGHRLLLDSLAWARARGWLRSTRLVVCGDAAYMQGPACLRALRAQVASQGLPVTFAGHLGGVTKAAALRLADAFVTASCHESYGLTTLEAMAAGLPVVGVRTHGSAATVDASCGILVDPGPHLPERLARALEGVVGSPRERARLALGARRRAASLRFADTAEALLSLLRPSWAALWP